MESDGVPQQAHSAPKDMKTTQERELKLMQKIQNTIKELNESQFFRAFLDQIHSPEVANYFHQRTRSGHKVKMVIYCIGSIESYEESLSQLSLAILMKRNLKWIGDMEVFDPVISLTESMVMKKLGFRVLSVNEQGKRRAVECILFFMPWCIIQLFNNLLETNWRQNMLKRIILLGTSFERLQRQYLELESTCLGASRPFTKEFKLPMVGDRFSREFVGLSWHFFSFK